MTEISDAYMHERLASARPFTVAILRHGPCYESPGAEAVIWEHGRRNMRMQAEGLLSIVCPVDDGSDLGGVAVFGTDQARTRDILAADPAVLANVFRFTVHPSFSFPGDSLAAAPPQPPTDVAATARVPR
jgi:hypothetical protein